MVLVAPHVFIMLGVHAQVLVDIVAVVFEVVVSINIVEFVDEELGEQIETALHYTSVAILSLFLKTTNRSPRGSFAT